MGDAHFSSAGVSSWRSSGKNSRNVALKGKTPNTSEEWVSENVSFSWQVIRSTLQPVKMLCASHLGYSGSRA